MDRYPYDKYTILLGATRALAHLGTHFTHRVYGLSGTQSPVTGAIGQGVHQTEHFTMGRSGSICEEEG